MKKKLLRIRKAPQCRSNNLNVSLKSNLNLNSNTSLKSNSNVNANINSNLNTNNSENRDLIPHRFIDKCKVVPEMHSVINIVFKINI